MKHYRESNGIVKWRRSMVSISGTKVMLGVLHMRQMTMDEVTEILEYYFDAGGIYLDSANLYGGIEFAEILSKAFKTLGVKPKLNYKFGYFENFRYYKSSRSFLDYIEQYIDILGDYICSIAVHEADWSIWWDANETCAQKLILESNVHKDGVSTISAIAADVKKLGFSFGYSGNNAIALESIGGLVDFDFLILAKQYDLLWRSGARLLNSSINNGREVYLAAPWHQGWLLNLDQLALHRPEMLPHIIKLQDFIKDNNYSIYELALFYCLKATENSGVIFGVKNAEEMRQAISTLNKAKQQMLPWDIDSIGADFPPMGPLIK